MPPIWLLTLVLKTGLTGRAARGVSWLAMIAIATIAVVGIVSALEWAWRSHNDDVATEAVENYQRDIVSEAANRVIMADRSANANAADADVVERQNEKELDDAVRDTGGNATRGVLERMRDQQAKGRR